ncbi:MAG: hypothetical protein ACYTEE_06930 [Planctomycetota bacterium]|jgi:hypothetical protein
MKVKIPTRACPGKEAPAYALKTLISKIQEVSAIKGHGQCLIRYQTEEKTEKLNFPIKLWAQPPDNFYLQGDIAFDPRALVVGSNEEEFWLSIKPKEISGYWWGQWQDGNRTETLLISPKMLLDVLGITPIDYSATQAWTLANDGVFDILTQIDGSGKLRQKIYVYCCDYTIRKVEYYDVDEELAAIVKMDKFKEFSQDLTAPTLINIVSNKEADPHVDIYIRLAAVSPTQLDQKQQQFLFVLPPNRKFENIYRIIDGQAVEQ